MPFTAVTLFSYIVICYKPTSLPYRIGLFNADANWQWIQYFAPATYADAHHWSILQLMWTQNFGTCTSLVSTAAAANMKARTPGRQPYAGMSACCVCPGAVSPLLPYHTG